VARFGSGILAGANTQRGLFDLPLSLPEDSIYQELNLDPSATAEEVSWAAKVLNDQRLALKSDREKKINKVFEKVPDLKEALEDKGDAKGSGSLDHRKSVRLADLLDKARRLDQDFLDHRRKVEELNAKILALNGLNLGNLNSLSNYDEARPPYALLKLAPAQRDEFLEQPRSELWLLRREITSFLERSGEAAAHTTDLDRENFAADMYRNPLLDGDN
jgi:hypothetical protein